MKNKVALILVIVLVFVIAAGGTYFLVSRGKGEAATATAEGKEAPQEAAKPAVIFHAGKITTNLAEQGTRRYIMLSMDLGVETEKAAKHLEEERSIVLDAAIAVLRAKRYEDVTGDQGPAALKKELRAKFNQVLGAEEVKEVYFTEFVVE